MVGAATSSSHGSLLFASQFKDTFQSAIRVFDDEAMRSYPWGRTAYEVLIDSIKTFASDGGSYTISGMKDALLIWAYESVTCFGESFGRVINNEDVLLLRWGGKRTRASLINYCLPKSKSMAR